MPKQSRPPTENELAKLPHRALAAFAVRQARRWQPLFGAAIGVVDLAEHQEKLGRAITLVEQFCGAESARDLDARIAAGEKAAMRAGEAARRIGCRFAIEAADVCAAALVAAGRSTGESIRVCATRTIARSTFDPHEAERHRVVFAKAVEVAKAEKETALRDYTEKLEAARFARSVADEALNKAHVAAIRADAAKTKADRVAAKHAAGEQAVTARQRAARDATTRPFAAARAARYSSSMRWVIAEAVAAAGELPKANVELDAALIANESAQKEAADRVAAADEAETYATQAKRGLDSAIANLRAAEDALREAFDWLQVAVGPHAERLRPFADAAAADYVRLMDLTIGKKVCDGDPIDSGEGGPLGPLWPDGRPDWIADDWGPESEVLPVYDDGYGKSGHWW